MKILQVIPYFSQKFGGSVTAPCELSKELAHRNHEVTIITTDYEFDPHFAESIRSQGITVISFPCVVNFGLFLYSPSIKKWLEKNLTDFDAIHLHLFRSYQNAAVRAFAIKYGIPYIVQAHGTVLPFFEKQFLKNCFDVMWGNKILKSAAICIALTKTESDQYTTMGIPKNKIVIIPNGIDISQYRNFSANGEFRSKYHIPENMRIILSLGRIHKIKGIDLLVEAFSQLCRQINNVKLVITGPDGGSLSEIQQQIHELQLDNDVLFTGPLFGKDKLEAYFDSDVFVLASRSEGFPYTVLEAWASGKAVIATNNCGIADIIRNSNAGAIVNFDPVQLKDKIRDFLDNDIERKKIGMNGLTLVINEYEINSIVQKFEFLYVNVKNGAFNVK